MRPTLLRPGRSGHLQRKVDDLYPPRKALDLFNIFRPDYVGMHGPNDDGTTVMTDAYVVRNVTLKPSTDHNWTNDQ